MLVTLGKLSFHWSTQSCMFVRMYYTLGKKRVIIIYFGIATIHSVFKWICEFLFSPDETSFKSLWHCCRTMRFIFLSCKLTQGDREMSQAFSHLVYSHQGTMQVCNHTQRRAGFPLKHSSRQRTSNEKPYTCMNFFSSYNNLLVIKRMNENPYNGTLYCRVKNQHTKAFIRRLYHCRGSEVKGFDSGFVLSLCYSVCTLCSILFSALTPLELGFSLHLITNACVC